MAKFKRIEILPNRRGVRDIAQALHRAWCNRGPTCTYPPAHIDIALAIAIVADREGRAS